MLPPEIRQKLIPDIASPIALSAIARQAGILRVSSIFLVPLLVLSLCSAQRSVHALTFNLTFDSSVPAAPAGFLPAVNSAVQFYQTNFTDPITINLQVGWGTINNQNMSPGAFGQSLVNGQLGSSFGAVKSALTNDAKTTADQTSVFNLPASDPTGGAPYLMAHAEAKALGLLAANFPALDGYVGFSNTASFTFDPNNRAVSGKYDFIGVAEHEFSEVMGRYGMGQNSGQLGRYSPIDDFRYASPGTLDLVPMNGAYFSIDGGVTVINTFNGPGGGDLGDWLGTTIDSYNAGPTIGVKNAVSAGDITVMDVIGYDAGPLVTGDYNGDGAVDAADYVVWRKTDGMADGYNSWRTHFGTASGGGVGTTNFGEFGQMAASTGWTAVPESSCALLLMLGATLLFLKPRAMVRKVSLALAALGLLACDAPSASAQLTFNFINQGGATPQMMTGFAQAGALWSAYLKDPITINIRVNAAGLAAGVLAHTDIFYDPFDYTGVRAALVNDRLSADDFSSTSTLQAAPAFSMLINRTANNPNGAISLTPYFDTGLGGPGQAGPENNNTVRFPTANAKALGLLADNPNFLDGIVTFSNSPIFDFDRSNGIAANRIDFVGVAAHEIGHVLGFTTGVDLLVGNSVPPGWNDNQLKFVTPLDLFRFTGRSIGPGGGIGVIDWTGDDTDKYFSVDGGQTPLAIFSRGTNDEEGHWKNDAGIGIMDPSAVAGDLLKISGMDVRTMDVIGYNLVATPELAGDFNSNSFVDAADYVIWRKNVGTNTALPNNLIGGTIGAAQYNQWRANFGNSASGASSMGATGIVAVPEPTTLLQMILAAAIAAAWRREG